MVIAIIVIGHQCSFNGDTKIFPRRGGLAMPRQMAPDLPLAFAAHQLGISWQQAWRAMLIGQLSGVKRGGRWFVTAASVSALAEQFARGDAA